MGYRLELDGCHADNFEPHVEVMPISEVNQVLDMIETIVNDALKQIDGISGIQAIDDCRQILNELSVNLY